MCTKSARPNADTAATVFYPADVAKGGTNWLGKHKGLAKGIDWFIDPVAESVRGYEHFGGAWYLQPWSRMFSERTQAIKPTPCRVE